MILNSYIAIIPSADIEKSLRFWVNGLGLTADQHMRREGKLIGCMVHDEKLSFWLNESEGSVRREDYDGIRLYWSPSDLKATHARLKELGYEVTAIEVRDYGQTEFFVRDEDGFEHCFGVGTKSSDVVPDKSTP